MDEILKIAKDFVKKNRTYPSMSELNSMGIKRDSVRHYFGNLSGLHDVLYKECRDFFFDFTKESLPSINLKKHKTFVITTAITGDYAHKKALTSIETYCKKF